MIEVSSEGGVGRIELNRPERRNALNVALCEAITEGMAELVAAGVRAVLVTGAGTSFCSGADFGEVYTDGFRDALYTALHAVSDAEVPTVAAVNGPAIGAGTQLAIACDLRVAAPEAVFGVPTARIGLAVDPWTVGRLTALAGGGTARSLLLACLQMDAETALGRGLVDGIGTRADALALASDLATMAPLTLRYNRLAIAGAGEGRLDALEVQAAFEACWASADLAEGRAARAEKRAPAFQGA